MNIHSPYPFEKNFKKDLIIAISISLFVGLFIGIFQPFGLYNYEGPDKSLILAGYGLVNFIILFIDIIILPILLKDIFKEEKWTVLKQVFWLLFILFTIGIGNLFYTRIVFGIPIISLKGFLIFELYTIAVGIIPITVLTMITYNLQLRRNLKDAAQLSQSPHLHKKPPEAGGKIIEILASSGKEHLKIDIQDLLFIRSEGNYVNVFYSLDGQPTRMLIRNTLKNIWESISNLSPSLLKTHRSFIVNTNNIADIKGNSQGLQLFFEKSDQFAQVSRTYLDIFKKNFEKS